MNVSVIEYKGYGEVTLMIFMTHDLYSLYYYSSQCSSDEWERVPKSEKDKMELKVADDGEFW